MYVLGLGLRLAISVLDSITVRGSEGLNPSSPTKSVPMVVYGDYSATHIAYQVDGLLYMNSVRRLPGPRYGRNNSCHGNGFFATFARNGGGGG